MSKMINAHVVRALACAIATAVATSAHAQGSTSPQSSTADSVEDLLQEVVVVSGYRASLESALAVKRDAIGVVDVIKAEDIADFPDNNLAESIQRVPGVSISRVAGEGRAITVRGLNPGFTRVRINGMEAQSASSATVSDRGANATRGFDFNVFASELFNSIAVRKTTAAEQGEGSLGATVDLSTPRPFDYEGFTFVTNLQESYNDLAKNLEPRVSGLVSNTWADNRVGALFSVAYSDRQFFEEGFGSGGWNPSTTDGGFCTPIGSTLIPALDATKGTDALNCATGVTRPAADDAYFPMYNQSTVFTPRLPRYGRFVHEQERLGMTGALQWKPAESTVVTLDALYSNYDVMREESWLEGFSFARAISQNGKPQTAVRYAELISRGISNTQGTNFGREVFDVGYAEFEGVDVRSETQHDEWESSFMQYTLSGTHEFNDRLQLNAMAGHSRNELAQPVMTTLMFQRPNAGLTMDFRTDRDRPIYTHDFDVTNSSLYTFGTGNSEVRLNSMWIDNDYNTGDVNLAFEFSDKLTFKGGVRYTDFGFESRQLGRPNNFLVPDLSSDQLASVTRLLTGFGDGGLEGRFPSSWVTADYDAFVNAYPIFSNEGMWVRQGVELAGPRSGIRSVGEEDSALYLQTDFQTQALGLPVRGDVGVRYVRTDLTSTGYQVAAAPLQVTAKHSYDDLLPALNLSAEFTPVLLGRFSVAKVVSRPEFSFLSPGGSVVLTGTPSVGGGNPYLDPIRATTYDLTAEWYFTNESLLSAGVFYKDIDSYIQNGSQQMSFRQTGLPLELLAGTNLDPDNTTFTVTRPLNTPGGPLKGLEISYQQPFTFLPGPLKHLGALVNYTHVESEITYFLAQGGTTTNDLLGLSKNAFNATMYWENSRLSARISASYRDPFLDALPANNPLQDVEGTDEMLAFDASAAYSINEHFKLTFEGLNIFDRYKRQYIDSDRNSTWVYGHTGATFNFGAQYKF